MVKETKKKSKKVKKSKVKEYTPSQKWEEAPNVIVQDGVPYEKIYDNTVDLAVDLDNDTIEKIQKRARAGLYVSESELMRDILRQLVIKEKK